MIRNEKACKGGRIDRIVNGLSSFLKRSSTSSGTSTVKNYRTHCGVIQMILRKPDETLSGIGTGLVVGA
jgi:hypothetical protein